jgi:hypothetical protein
LVQAPPDRCHSVTARSGLSGLAVRARATLAKPGTDFETAVIRRTDRTFAAETEAGDTSAPTPGSTRMRAEKRPGRIH